MGDALRDAMEMPQGMDVEQELKPLVSALADRLRYARRKHEWPTIDTDPKAHFYALSALYGEAAELMEAVTDGQGRAREKDEAMDVIVVALRILLGDHLPGGRQVRELSFCLPITPTAQQRPRHARFGAHDVTYKSATQKANERMLEACLLPHRPKTPLSGPLELSFCATFPVPRSWAKKRREAALRGKMWHTAKPDTDNLAKQLKDAMTRLGFWDDDRQVAAYGRMEKLYGERGEWRVRVRELESGEKREEA